MITIEAQSNLRLYFFLFAINDKIGKAERKSCSAFDLFKSFYLKSIIS